MSDLAAALAKLQADLPRIKRTQPGQHGKYAAYDKILAAVRPIMAKHGFAWWSAPGLAPMGGHTEWRFVLHYVLTYLPTGETIDGSYPLAEGPPQQQGAVITYARRYCLTSVLDLEIEGDDSMDAPQRARPVRGAKVTGPEHERLRDGLHTATPDDRPGSIANSQRGGMHMAFSAIGITDRAERLAMTRDILGLPDLLSSNDLSYTQAAALLLALKERTGVREGR